jgi:hypothetical protein
MSEDFSTISNTGSRGIELTLSTFFGGDTVGTMMQITQGVGFGPDEPGFIQLTPADTYRLIGELARWLKGVAEKKAATIQKTIEENKVLRETVLQDAVECEHFISDLRVLNIPLRLLGMGGDK